MGRRGPDPRRRGPRTGAQPIPLGSRSFPVIPRPWIRRLFDREPRTVRTASARRPLLGRLDGRLAPAGFGLGALTNYGLLFEGGGGRSLTFNNNSVETGDIGIGGTGKLAGGNSSLWPAA